MNNLFFKAVGQYLCNQAVVDKLANTKFIQFAAGKTHKFVTEFKKDGHKKALDTFTQATKAATPLFDKSKKSASVWLNEAQHLVPCDGPTEGP